MLDVFVGVSDDETCLVFDFEFVVGAHPGYFDATCVFLEVDPGAVVFFVEFVDDGGVDDALAVAV